MKKLIFYNNIVYIGLSKTGSTTVMRLMDEIKNKYRSNSIDFTIDPGAPLDDYKADNCKKINESFGKKVEQFFKNKTVNDYVVFSHVRDPWSRFLSAVQQDFKENNKNLTQEQYESSLYNFLQEIKDNYVKLHKNFHYEKYLHIFSGNYQGIKQAVDILKNHIKKIELWNFKYFRKSINFHFKLNLLYHENKSSGTKLREIVNTFFNSDNDFKQKWQEKNQKDIFLYNLLKEKEKISLDVRYLIKNYFKN